MKKAVLFTAAIISFLFAKNVSVTYKEYPSFPIKPKAAFTFAQFEDLPVEAKNYTFDEDGKLFKFRHPNHESCFFDSSTYHDAVSDSVNAIIRAETDCEVVSAEHAEYIIWGSMFDQGLNTTVEYAENTNQPKAKRTAYLSTTFYVIDAKTNDTVFTKLCETQTSCNALGKNRTEATKNCDNPKKMHATLTGWLARSFCREIFCMETTQKIFLHKGKGKEFKAATVQALEGNWDGAVPVWEKAAVVKKTKKDALWNLFQYNYYVKQDFSKAVEHMKALYEIKDRKHFKRLMDQATQQVENEKKYKAMSM